MRGVYLVGSVPLATVSEVFERVAVEFGPRLKRIPDGEVGARTNWSHFESLFRENGAFEPSAESFRVHDDAPERRRYRLIAGVMPEQVRFSRLGYAEAAIKSYAIFKALRDRGKLAPTTRFQVGLVPAHSVLLLFAVDDEQRALDPVFNRALTDELDVILNAIPNGDLAVQFDVASAVFAALERERLTERVPHVPEAERLGVEELGKGLVRAIVHFGFADQPALPPVIATHGEQLGVTLDDVSFFLGRETPVPIHPPLALWREKLFAFMTRNAVSASDYFQIPLKQVVELGTQVEL